MKLIKLNIILLIIIFYSLTYSQTRRDTLNFNLPSYSFKDFSTNFDKQLNTYLLYSKLSVNEIQKSYFVFFNEEYGSSLIKSTDKSIRDENFLTVLGGYNFTDKISGGILANNVIYSDNRKIEINQASISNAYLFGKYTPQRNVYFSAYMGATNNRQIGENDNGFSYGLEGLAQNEIINDFLLNGSLRLREEDISPRKNILRNINLSVSRYFTNDILNQTAVSYNQVRKDFYFQADPGVSSQFNIRNNIQSRDEIAYSLQNRLFYNDFLELFTLDLTGRVYFRSIERETKYRIEPITSSSAFDTEINELRFELEGSGNYVSDIFSGSLRFYYSERDEKHLTKNIRGSNIIFFEERSKLEAQKNNHSIRATLTAIGSFNITKFDKLSFSFFQNKLRYDTPSDLNFDDRDEILSLLRINYTRIISPYFQFFINAEGNLSHLVYIFPERSSNNNINRIIKLLSGGRYESKKFTSYNSFEVSANYTVYDFEDINPNYKSFSFRQFTAYDSTTVPIYGTLKFILNGYIKFSEQGELRWKEFAMRPVRYSGEYYNESKLIHEENEYLIGLGLRFFMLETFRYQNAERITDSRYQSIAPLAEFQVYLHNRLYMRLYGFYEFITILNSDKKESANLSMLINWNF